MDKYTIGLNIRKGRVKKGLSRDELATTLKVSKQRVVEWETCRIIPENEMIDSISKTLDMDLIDRYADRFDDFYLWKELYMTEEMKCHMCDRHDIEPIEVSICTKLSNDPTATIIICDQCLPDFLNAVHDPQEFFASKLRENLDAAGK